VAGLSVPLPGKKEELQTAWEESIDSWGWCISKPQGKESQWFRELFCS